MITRFSSETTRIFCLLCVALFLLTTNPGAQGARVAGEKGVTPVRKPTAIKARTKPPALKKPHLVEQKVPPKKAPPRKKTVEQQAPRQKEEAGSRYVTIDFDNVDIALFIKFISELTGKNFVVDKAVRGKVTIISPTKISVDEAYRVFESVLEVHGFTTVPAGSVIKIVPAVHARGKSIETRLREEAIEPEDKVVTQLIPLEYANPDQLKKLFAPLISKSSVIVSYPPTNMLIVTDVLSNIKRLLQIVKAIDVVGIGAEISVIPLKHATATVLVKSVSSVFQTRVRKRGAPVTPGIKIVADERTNSLIVAATEDETLKVKHLIKLLDKEIPRGEGKIHVYYLQNANAEDLAKVLTALPSKQAKGTVKGKAPVISKEVQIVADKATNSLVITADKDDYAVIEDVIKKLDIPRRMVYIECLIMEVSTKKSLNLGVEWRAGGKYGGGIETDKSGSGGVYFGGSSSGGLPMDLSDDKKGLMIPAGLAVGVVGNTIILDDKIFPTLAALVSAIQTDGDFNIISTPQILTMDNEEAEIKVGENVPFLTKSATGDQQYETYEYKDVGVNLKVTPQINKNRFVRLELEQEVKDVVQSAVTLDNKTILAPTTKVRSSKSTITVKDSETVVIAGLIDKSIQIGKTQVPCLGNIPGLGWLFKSISRERKKSNLFVFLTPHVIENPTEAKKIYEEKKGEMDTIREGVIKMYERPEARNQNPE